MLICPRNLLEKAIKKKKMRRHRCQPVSWKDTQMLNQHLEELLYRGSLGGQANFYFNLKEKKHQSQAEWAHGKGDAAESENKYSRAGCHLAACTLLQCVCHLRTPTILLENSWYRMCDREAKIDRCLGYATIHSPHFCLCRNQLSRSVGDVLWWLNIIVF